MRRSIDWIWHLSEKLWFTPQHLADFLYWVDATGLDPRNWPNGVRPEKNTL